MVDDNRMVIVMDEIERLRRQHFIRRLRVENVEGRRRLIVGIAEGARREEQQPFDEPDVFERWAAGMPQPEPPRRREPDLDRQIRRHVDGQLDQLRQYVEEQLAAERERVVAVAKATAEAFDRFDAALGKIERHLSELRVADVAFDARLRAALAEVRVVEMPSSPRQTRDFN
jgi:hypothetical protein